MCAKHSVYLKNDSEVHHDERGANHQILLLYFVPI